MAELPADVARHQDTSYMELALAASRIAFTQDSGAFDALVATAKPYEILRALDILNTALNRLGAVYPRQLNRALNEGLAGYEEAHGQKEL